jgi:heme A synthase
VLAALDRHLTRPRLAVWAAATALLGWALMSVGAFVRASESGLGCPDWPGCHGVLVAAGHHAVIEEAHRWVATVLSVAVIALALMIFRAYRRERRLTRPAAAMLGLLALQVVLGGVTVLLKNVSWTVVAHYAGAALLVAAIALVGVRLAYPDAEAGPSDGFSRLVSWFVWLSFGLLLAGSTVANTDSHTSCGQGFPLCNGSPLPTLEHHTVINLTHRIWAGATLALALVVFARSRSARRGVPAIERAAAATAVLYLAQAGLGIAVVAVGENTAVEVMHSSLGSLTWLALATLLALTRTLPAQPSPMEPPAYVSSSTKSRLRAPHTGQIQVSGIPSKGVPGGIPPSGSPNSGS